MGIPHQEWMHRSLDGIDQVTELAKDAALTIIDQTPVGTALALQEGATGSDIEGNEVSRPRAALRLLLNRIPAARFGGGVVARIVNKVDDIGDGGRAFAKGHAFAKTPIKTVGQIHHVISTKVARAVDDHPILSGLFSKRDPRFITQAVDGAAHRGYQRWHRDLDDEVVRWIRSNSDKNGDDFLAFLRGLYERPDIKARFPNGF